MLGTLYDGEKFQLEFKFGSRYPFESPEVKSVMINHPSLIMLANQLIASFVCDSFHFWKNSYIKAHSEDIPSFWVLDLSSLILCWFE